MSGIIIRSADVEDAHRFYEAMGGRAFTTQTIEIGGKKLDEVAYGWHDLLANQASK